jgi:oligoendopeptidase F
MIRARSDFPQISIAIFLVVVLSVCAVGQAPIVPIRTEDADKYRLNFARNFFASPAAEKADRNKLYDTLSQLEAFKNQVGTSPDRLLRALELNDSLLIQFHRHYSYLYLRYATDTRDENSLADSSALEADITKRTAFLRSELIQLSPQTIAKFVAEKSQLRKYLPALEGERRYQPHTLSVDQEAWLNETAEGSEWPAILYEKLRARTPLAPYPSGADSQTRQEIFKRNYVSQQTQRDLYAFALLNLIRLRTRRAQFRHFEDAASEVYFRSYWTRKEVDGLVNYIAEKAEIYKRYQRIRAAYAKKISGNQDVNVWDLSIRPASFKAPQFAIREATKILLEAMSPLGPEYSRELSALLDPSNGRMDIVPGENRKSGGFSQGFLGTDSVFFSQGFRGSYNDVRVLAHESTHAVHRQLMNVNRVLPAYADGPNFLFEAFAIFSEFLLIDYLNAVESDPMKKQFYLEQFLEGKGTSIFTVAPEVALEHEVYDAVKRGAINGADDLDQIAKKIYARYSIWPDRHDELKTQWMNVRLMYEDPFYDVNYIYGSLLALNFYDMFLKDRQSFVSRYIALMRNGFDAPPEVLLKKFLNLDLYDPRTTANALALIEAKIRLLERSYGV